VFEASNGFLGQKEAVRWSFAMLHRIVSRRSHIPSTPDLTPDRHATRRGTGGARREASDRVVLRDGTREFEGWTLNVSRGGIRVILEDPVEPGHECEIIIGEESGRACRIVWVQDESDGQIAGIQFLDATGGGAAPDREG
jgi:hypothetical protein